MSRFIEMISREFTEMTKDDKSKFIDHPDPMELKGLLKKGIVHFRYLKKDGETVRDAWGTKNMKIIEDNAAKPGGGYCPPKSAGYTIYFDLEKGGWRAYLDSNVIGMYDKVMSPYEFDFDLEKYLKEIEKDKIEKKTAKAAAKAAKAAAKANSNV